MSVIENVDLTIHLLPDDAIQAKQDFLHVLHDPFETWIMAYNFSLPELYTEIRIASMNGVIGHCLLDHTQSQGPSEKLQLLQLAKDCPNWEFIITSSQVRGKIWHDKTLVSGPDSEGFYNCIEGSTNMSIDGFNEGNTMLIFKSKIYALAVLTQFKTHEQWTLDYHKDWQIAIDKSV